jgi:hypothetical protein
MQEVLRQTSQEILCIVELANGVALWSLQALSETQVPGELVVQDSVSVYC